VTNPGLGTLGNGEVAQLSLIALRAGVDRTARRTSSPIALVEDLDLLLQADEAMGGRLVMSVSSLVDAEGPFILTASPQARERLRSSYPTLAARFTTVEVPAADEALTMAVLELLRPVLQEFHKVTIEDAALTAAVELAQAVSAGRVLPGRAVDLLDAAAAGLAIRPRETTEGAEPTVLREQDVRAAA
jgi:ATP-dependent Clp protease ATP-binding subunit ClpC